MLRWPAGIRMDEVCRRALTRIWGGPRADGRARTPPATLVLGINNTCNLHCAMCDVGLGDSSTVFWANLIGDDPRNMTLGLLESILQQAQAFWPRPRIGLAFTEPLIHPRIVDFVRAIRAHGLSSSITSNGTELPRLAEPLVLAGLDDLILSVDGPRAVHDRIRGGRDSFDKMYRGVQALDAARARCGSQRPRVRFSFTVTEHNCGHLLEFVQAIAALQPRDIIISHLNFITAEMAQAHNRRHTGDLSVVRSNLGSMEPAAFPLALLAEQIAAVQSYARTARPRPLRLTFVPGLDGTDRLATYYRDPLTPIGGTQCTDPWTMMMIKTDGGVIPSHGRCYNFAIGNVSQAPLAELWNNQRFRQFRRTLQAEGGTLPACLRCCGVVGKPAAANATTATRQPGPEPLRASPARPG